MRSRVVASLAAIAIVAATTVGIDTPASAAPPTRPHTSSVSTGTVANQLNSVSCLAFRNCVAVGQAGVSPIAEVWDGVSWSVVPSPKVTGALAAVSCPSPVVCFAVGKQRVANSTRTLIERWNGQTWSVVESPNPLAATGAELRGVSCRFIGHCFAVGTQRVPGAVASKTLVLRWNGKRWSILTAVSPANARSLTLNAIHCQGALDCFAVGSYKTAGGSLETLIERWNGARWSVSPSPTPNVGTGSELLGVSCSTEDCFAVGYSQFANTDEAVSLIERWDGHRWSVIATPPQSRTFNKLRGVSCTGAKFCFTVGYLQYNGDPYYVAPITYALRWNGKGWSNSPSPSPGATESGLAGISCVFDAVCNAVGSFTNSNFDRSRNKLRTLAERWNGKQWIFVASPNGGNAPFATLTDVSCPSVTNCFAVGNALAANGQNKSLIQRWNGTTWSIMSSPNPAGATISQLAGISCASDTSCVAVGRYTTTPRARADDTGPFKTLIERWNGTSWSIVASPNPSASIFARLDRVSSATTTTCVAIGVSSATFSSTDKPLSARWDGAAWSIVPSPSLPDRGPADVGLSGISCSTTTHCMAVYGYSYGTGRPLNFMLVEQWDGTKWTNIGSSGNEMDVDFAFSGVSCTSPTSCVITGTITQAIGIGFAVPHVLIEQWNGADWSIVENAPRPASGSFPRLDSVSCASPTNCIAVGGYSTNKYFFDPAATLSERWDGTSWTLVSSPNPAGASSTNLAGVSCATATSCMAVGSYQVASTAATRPLTERWDGTSWTIVPAS